MILSSYSALLFFGLPAPVGQEDQFVEFGTDLTEFTLTYE
jgi:hypothetical protein